MDRLPLQKPHKSPRNCRRLQWRRSRWWLRRNLLARLRPQQPPLRGHLDHLVHHERQGERDHGHRAAVGHELRSRGIDLGAHDVRTHGAGTKRFVHPVVGEVELAYEELAVTAEPGRVMLVYTAEPGSPSAERLRLLASYAASEVAGL